MSHLDLLNLLDEDAKQAHAMHATPGAETLSTAIAKAVGVGKHTLKEILAAAVSGYLTGGYAGAIAAVLALLVA